MPHSSSGEGKNQPPRPAEPQPPTGAQADVAAKAKPAPDWDAWQASLLGNLIEAPPKPAPGKTPAPRKAAAGIAAVLPRTVPAAAAPAFTYRISDALPLHRLGLVPPPPEIGAHLLSATPLEVAAAAAAKTALLMARLPGSSEPEPPPSEPAPALASATPATLATDAPTLTELAPPVGAALPDDLRTRLAATPAAPDQDPEFLTLPASPERSQTSTASASHADTVPTVRLVPQADAIRIPARQPSLSTLDLSGRGRSFNEPALASHDVQSDAAGASRKFPLEIGGSLLPKLAHPIMSLRMSYEKHRSQSPDLEPRSNWPGFLTGFVTAMVIGIGLYISLSGS